VETVAFFAPIQRRTDTTRRASKPRSLSNAPTRQAQVKPFQRVLELVAGSYWLHFEKFADSFHQLFNGKTKTKIVEFENRKRRGNVVTRVSFSFSIEDGLSYQELLASVCLVDETELVAVKQAEAIKSDTDIISAVIACIDDGINTKLRLRDAVSDRIGCSKRAAVRIIEKYDGTDPAAHKWCHAVGERGAQVFSLLIPDSAVSDLAGEP
jgi:hypothetical protein